MKAHRKTDEIKYDVLGEGYREGVGCVEGIVGDGGRTDRRFYHEQKEVLTASGGRKC